MNTKDVLIEKAKAFISKGYVLPNPTDDILYAISQMMADFVLSATLSPEEMANAANPEVPITAEEIVVILKDFEEDTLMRGRRAIPPKNYPHAANYIIKKIKTNLKKDKQENQPL